MALASLAQLNFALGMWRAVARHLIPAEGAWDLPNNLLDDDGSVYRRGGSSYLSTAGLGSTGLTGLWDGFLGVGARTLIANASDFGTLDGSEGPINLGGAGLAASSRAVEVGGIVFVGGGAMWAGSRKTAPYTTGTVTVTQGSASVTGSGTTWNTLVDAGMLFKLGSGRSYVVKSIDSTTTLTLAEPYEGGNAAGQSYTLANIDTAASPYKSASMYAVAADRLFAFEGDRAYFTEPGKPHTFDLAESFHELPEGSDTLGGEKVGDRLLWFATSGLWMVSNLDFDLTDAFGNSQHRVEHANPDLILWGHEGIASYRGALVAPCADHVWLTDGIGAPEPITRSIAPMYRDYVAAGYRPGIATVFRSHYFLPVLNGSGVPVDLLVCRLDRPSKSPIGAVYPWTRWEGFTALVSALTVRTGGGAGVRNPKLLAASTETGSRVLDLGSCFGPDVAEESEPDGSVHHWAVDTRDYPTGNARNTNTVRRVRVRYELVDAGSDDPTLSALFADGTTDLSGVSLWGSALWGTGVWEDEDAGEWAALSGQAPEDSGREPYVWHVNRRVRFARFRLASSDPAARLVVRTVELFVRKTGKD